MLGQSQGKGLIHLLSENCLNSLFTVNLRSASHLNFQVQKVAMSRAFIMQYCNILSFPKRLMEKEKLLMFL